MGTWRTTTSTGGSAAGPLARSEFDAQGGQSAVDLRALGLQFRATLPEDAVQVDSPVDELADPPETHPQVAQGEDPPRLGRCAGE